MDHGGMMAHPRALALAPHLTTAELSGAARACTDADVRLRIDAIRLISMGWSLVRVGEAVGRARGWVREQLKRYNDESLVGLDDRRWCNKGRTAYLDEDGVTALRAALAKKAPDGGLWTGPKVRAWIAARLGRPVGVRLGWRYLQRLGYSIQQPQTKHGAADPAAQETFKKTSRRSSTSSARTSATSTPTPSSRSGRKTRRGSG